MHVVKSLNTSAIEVLVDPSLVGPATVFVSGDDEAAKAEVKGLLHDLGWKDEGIMDLGGIRTARGPENYARAVLRDRRRSEEPGRQHSCHSLNPPHPAEASARGDVPQLLHRLTCLAPSADVHRRPQVPGSGALLLTAPVAWRATYGVVHPPANRR